MNLQRQGREGVAGIEPQGRDGDGPEGKEGALGHSRAQGVVGVVAAAEPSGAMRPGCVSSGFTRKPCVCGLCGAVL